MKKVAHDQQVGFLRDLVLIAIKSVVECEDAVRVEAETPADGVLVLSAHVAQSDVGMTLGRDGIMLKSIRTWVWAASRKTRFRECSIHLVSNGAMV